MTRDEYQRCMAHWERERTDGRPLIPYSHQVEVCDFWRAEAAHAAEQRRREIRAERFGEPAVLTAWRGLPWQDTA